MPTKDDLRVLRSIESISKKLEIALKKSQLRKYEQFLKEEKELEEYCISHGMVYSPTKFVELI